MNTQAKGEVPYDHAGDLNQNLKTFTSSRERLSQSSAPTFFSPSHMTNEIRNTNTYNLGNAGMRGANNIYGPAADAIENYRRAVIRQAERRESRAVRLRDNLRYGLRRASYRLVYKVTKMVMGYANSIDRSVRSIMRQIIEW